MDGHSEATESVSVLGHDIESFLFDGEEHKLVCSCGWETWRRPDEWHAREDFNDHIFDDVNTQLTRLHEARKVETL